MAFIMITSVYVYSTDEDMNRDTIKTQSCADEEKEKKNKKALIVV